MNILIIGATNKLGSWVINELLKIPDIKVLSIDNIVNEDNLKYVMEFEQNENYSFYKGNILNDGFIEVKLDIAINNLFNGKIDHIINLSGYKDTFNEFDNQLLFLDICCIGMKNISYLSVKYNANLHHIYSTNDKYSYYTIGNKAAVSYIYGYEHYLKTELPKLNYKIYHIENISKCIKNITSN
jgi:nucleoside-diphosphate-sugar epimerase